jgi:hypothetical protein
LQTCFAFESRICFSDSAIGYCLSSSL